MHRTPILTIAATLIGLVLPSTQSVLADSQGSSSPRVEVREVAGVYKVAAQFGVHQIPEIALSVLSDYEQIPRFMPDVRTSRVRERAPGRLVVNLGLKIRAIAQDQERHPLAQHIVVHEPPPFT